MKKIFCLALCIRVATVFAGIGYDRDLSFWDMRDYDRHALSLLNGNGFTNGTSYSSRPPVYPFLLAVTYFFFGHHYHPIRLFQSLLDSLSIVFLFFINRRFFSRRVCFLAALFCTFHPILVFYCGNILTETTSLFLLSGVILVCLRAAEKESVGWEALGGILFGLLLLTKSSLLPVFPFMAIWMLGIRRIKVNKRLKLLATFTLCTALVIAPWSIRNYRIHHAFIPLTTSSGTSLWDANNPKALEAPEVIGLQADWIMVGNVFKEEGGKKIRLSEVEGDRYLVKRAFAFQKSLLLDRPGTFLLRLFRKFLAAWSFHPGQHPVEYLLFFLAYTLALGGWILSLRQRPKPLLHYFLILQYLLTALVYYGRAKYRVPIEPYVMVFTALGCLVCLQFLRKAFSLRGKL